MPEMLLVNVVDREIPGFSSYRKSKLPPLAMAYLASVTPSHWKVRLIDENFEAFRPDDLGGEGPDLVAVSAMTPDVWRAYRIADACRERGLPVVMGGVHASMNTEEALEHVDAVVVGEAERAWPRVLEAWESGRLERVYPGTWEDLTDLELPRREIFAPAYRTATVQTARGCPFHCEFCSVSRFNGGRYRTRPVEAVLDELGTIRQKAIFFVDDNLFGTGGMGRQRALELFRGIVGRGLRKYWLGQTSLEMAGDRELLSWAARSGCKLLLVGFESLHADSLQEMRKQVNLRLDPLRYRDAIRSFHRHGIAVWGAFIFGNDGETPETLHRTRVFLRKSRLDVLQLTTMTPLPGTRLYERMSGEGRIHYRSFPEDWRRYSFMECVIRPQGLSKHELDRALYRLRKKYWSSHLTIAARFLRTWWDTRSLTSALAASKMNRSWRTIFRDLYGGPWRPPIEQPARMGAVPAG